MSDEIQFYLEESEESMQQAVQHFDKELQRIRAGKANPQVLESIRVDYYGSSTPLSQVANVTTPDARTLVIQPFEKSLITVIEKEILAANLGFNPQNDGIVIRIVIPPLTEERRKELVKKAKGEGENAKVTVRNCRRSTIEAAKKLQKEGVSEDAIKKLEKDVQDLTDKFSLKIDDLLKVKEKEIMTI